MTQAMEHSGADMNPQTCVFCQIRPAVSAEHIYRKTYRRYAGSNTYGQIDFNTGEVHQLPPGQSAFNQKVKVVCGQCNSGWMNKIDEDVEDAMTAFFEGRPYSCDEATAALLALGATRTTMMRAFKDPDRAIQDHEMKYLYDHHEPPPGWSVFLGHTDTVGNNNESRHVFPNLNHLDPTVASVTELPSGLVVPLSEQGYFQAHAVAVQQMLLITFGLSGPQANPGFMSYADAINKVIAGLRGVTPAPVFQLWPQPTAFEWPGDLPQHPIKDFFPLLGALPLIAAQFPGGGGPAGQQSVF